MFGHLPVRDHNLYIKFQLNSTLQTQHSILRSFAIIILDCYNYDC